MFVVTDARIELDPTDIAELAAYLRLPSAQRVLKAWIARRPTFLEKGSSEEIIVSAAKSSGYEAAIAELFAFIEPVPKETRDEVTTAYPDLENDVLWEQGTAKLSDTAPSA